MATPPIAKMESVEQGGAFLVRDSSPDGVFTPEDFSEEQRQIFATASRFMTEEVLPAIGELERQSPGQMRTLLKKAGDLGLLSVFIPEEYGGLEMSLGTALVVAECVGRYASFSTTYGAHADIGTRPLLFFGTPEQKRRYLPRLASGEMVGAYCLSEPHAGSDALAARTRAELSPDGKHYVLNGEKMWISNGGWADLYTVFAKIDGEKFTAFLVERATPGVQPGAEEKKMGIKGSSTTPLVLDNVKIPAGNVLGEVGRGHIIAFNILNIGRLELGASCIGGGKDVLAEAIRYAKQRKAFGQLIIAFGLIRHKLAEMAVRLFAAESLVYRTSGLIDSRLAGVSWNDPGAAKKGLAAIEEFAIECSIAKVYCSEALDFMVDEGVQIHGGYGFHQDYAVERAYRDSRINRIFEGTNEINRLLITSMLLKRSAQGRLDLQDAIKQLANDLAGGVFPREDDAGNTLGTEKARLALARKTALWIIGLAWQRYGDQIEQQQEVAAALAELAIAVYAAESALLRTGMLLAHGRGETALVMTRVLVQEALAAAAGCAEQVLPGCSEGETLAGNMKLLRRLLGVAPVDAVALRRQICDKLAETERLTL